MQLRRGDQSILMTQGRSNGFCIALVTSPIVYHFRLSALSEPSLPVASSATCVEIITLAMPYVLEFVELLGHYQR